MLATTRLPARFVAVVSAAIVTVGCASGPASAQQPYPQQPAPAGVYPNAAPSQPQQYGAPPQAAAPRPSLIRELFVGTLSAVLQGASGAIAGSLVQGVTGSITNWFAKKGQKYGVQPQFGTQPQYGVPTDPYAVANPNAAYGGTPYPATTYPPATDPYATAPAAPPATDPYATAPAYPSTDPYATAQNPAYPAAPYPAAGVDPYATGATQGATQYYDPQTGQTGSASAYGYGYANATSGYDGTLYAGLAYEVHALQPDGSSVPVNAAVHEFRTGDRFMVHYRPSLPGRLDVFNINPLGVQTRIDSVEMAAGQLASLGPYQFTANKGDEALRLVLAPCSTPQLLTATRDIVNVSGNVPASGGVSLGNCGVVGRSVDKVKTRDISKVAVDGTTSFALDPVSQTEFASGNVASREITIVFHHR